MSAETTELTQYLNEIAVKSEEGKLEWQQLNPTSFKWSQEDKGLTVTIQKAEAPVSSRSFSTEKIQKSLARELIDQLTVEPRYPKTTYLFQVFSSGKREPILSISSKERPEMYSALLGIYRAVEKSVDMKANLILKKLLSK
ncbi:hypothetical protein L9G74_19090 [Shewanella sp. C32]|uniref:Uncharacterized protein n=1 Tax=Shewanella electrica TaxID=515560 RepID=A0ABT2FR65_9GAMM|nr:hypothetical protein [Shewanella electrica]MCH1926864.1 hypothetical protein [Shewanella electrica]MCS4558546.1 hypothetical protein [Shewanella electrica]